MASLVGACSDKASAQSAAAANKQSAPPPAFAIEDSTNKALPAPKVTTHSTAPQAQTQAQKTAASDIKTPTIPQIQKYLQNLTTARARFIQTAPDGTQRIGTFYLSRPGRLRFEYDPPVKDFIVADGFFIYFYDSELGEQSNAPIGQTLADFLLRPDIKLSGDITVKQARQAGTLFLVTLVQTDDPGAGSLTLGFEQNPLKLKKWRVVDATGAITEVELFKLQTGMKLDKSLFYYINPNKLEDNPKYND